MSRKIVSLVKPFTNYDDLKSDINKMAEKLNCPYCEDVYEECIFGWHEKSITCEECKKEWLLKPYKEK